MKFNISDLFKVNFGSIFFLLTFLIGNLFILQTVMADESIKPICNSIETCLPLAKKGNVKAQYYLSGYYDMGFDDKGNKVNVSKEKAIYWCKKAAEKGNVHAQYDLSVLYKRINDELSEFWWCRKAARNGCAMAQAVLADKYRNGTGTIQDYSKALYWRLRAINSEKAASIRTSYDELLVADMYRMGEGTPQNYTKAFYWYQKAAMHGEQVAQFHVGLLYFLGYGVKKNLLKAFVWADLSLTTGKDENTKYFQSEFLTTREKKDAQTFMDNIYRYMTVEQRNKAEKLSELYWNKIREYINTLKPITNFCGIN